MLSKTMPLATAPNTLRTVAATATAVVLASLWADDAHASLIGQEVRFECPECAPPFDETFTVLEGEVELTPFDQLEIDVEAESIEITWLIDGNLIDPGHFIFSELSWGKMPGDIVDITIDPASTWQPVNVSFTADSVSIDISGGVVAPGDFILIHLEVEHIPAPGALSLIAIATLWRGRRRRRGEVIRNSPF